MKYNPVVRRTESASIRNRSTTWYWHNASECNIEDDLRLLCEIVDVNCAFLNHKETSRPSVMFDVADGISKKEETHRVQVGFQENQKSKTKTASHEKMLADLRR